jgi:unsaturated rhamnogalacturonyl hydrolase
VGKDLGTGTIQVKGDGYLFHDPHVLYMKDTCTISIKDPAKAALINHGDVMMATARYGKGTVFAIVDPWLYNEYTDGRKLRAKYDNAAAGVELVRWILNRTVRKPKSMSSRMPTKPIL